MEVRKCSEERSAEERAVMVRLDDGPSAEIGVAELAAAEERDFWRLWTEHLVEAQRVVETTRLTE